MSSLRSSNNQASLTREISPAAPLEGVRVLDLSQAVSGPYAGRILADLGADVVKVQWPNGDVANYFGSERGGVSGLFTHMNAGKRGIAVDLNAPSGPSVVKRLAIHADVLIENFRPGVLDRAGIGYSSLEPLNTRLVMLSISGFGQSSPEAGRMAFAPVIHAESGLLRRQADLDHSPHLFDVAFSVADILAGLHGSVAVLAALNMRTDTGHGQHIDLSMLEAMVASDDYAHYALDDSGRVSPQRGEVWDAPGGPLMIAADLKLTWVKLRDSVGLKDTVNDPEMPQEEREAHRRALIKVWIDSFEDRCELVEALESAGLAWAEVRSMAHLTKSPTLLNLGTIAEVSDGVGGFRGVVRMPYRFSDARSRVQGRAPVGGEHGKEILTEWLQLSRHDIDKLFDEGTLAI